MRAIEWKWQRGEWQAVDGAGVVWFRVREGADGKWQTIRRRAAIGDVYPADMVVKAVLIDGVVRTCQRREWAPLSQIGPALGQVIDYWEDEKIVKEVKRAMKDARIINEGAEW